MRAGLVLLLVWSAGSASCVIGPTYAETQTVAPPIEVMLARIDLGEGGATPAAVIPYVRVLDSLQSHCREPRIRIATMSVAAVQELERRYGEKRSTLTLLQRAADGLGDAGLKEVRCQDALAAVVVQIGEESGLSAPADEIGSVP